MEWLRISTTTELVRVSTDEIVYVLANGNYSDIVLTSGQTRKLTLQLRFFEQTFEQLHDNMFVRVGRSLIVNKRYVFVINLTERKLLFAGQQLSPGIKSLSVPRDALKELKEKLEKDQQ